MEIRRGGVYEYSPVVTRPGGSTRRLVISADHLNSDPAAVMTVGLLVEDGDPGGLLAVRLGAAGWASVIRIERLLPSRLGELVYRATEDEMDAVGSAMRAAYDL